MFLRSVRDFAFTLEAPRFELMLFYVARLKAPRLVCSINDRITEQVPDIFDGGNGSPQPDLTNKSHGN